MFQSTLTGFISERVLNPQIGGAMSFRLSVIVPAMVGILLCAKICFASEPLELRQGRIEIIDRARLACDQTGIVAQEIPPEGTQIKAGDIVVRLQDDIPKAALAAAEVLANSDADVRAKKNATEIALVELERAQQANERFAGTVPELEVKKLELTYRQAILETEMAEKELEMNQRRRDQSKALLESYAVKAPFDGTVTRVMKQMGEAVRQGDPILELVSVDRVRIAIEVPLRHRDRLKEGLQVTVFPMPESSKGTASTRLLGDTSQPESVVPEADSSQGETHSSEGLPGTMTFIDSSAEQLSQTVRVHIIVDDNKNQLLVPGLNAMIRIEGDSAASN